MTSGNVAAQRECALGDSQEPHAVTLSGCTGVPANTAGLSGTHQSGLPDAASSVSGARSQNPGARRGSGRIGECKQQHADGASVELLRIEDRIHELRPPALYRILDRGIKRLCRPGA